MAALRLRDGEEPLNELRRKIRQDLCHFEGNAQGIRLVHTLMRMNLTWAQVGGILKYTRPAWWRGETPETHHYLMKKGKQAVVAAAAGADFIAPSAAMDGQVQAIRQALDAAGFKDTAIMSYSTKFASSFYGPFREAAGSALKGDRKSYQMNPIRRWI